MDSLLLSMSVDREIKQRLAEKWKCQEFIYLGNTVLVLEVDTERILFRLQMNVTGSVDGPIGLWEQLSQQE